MKITPPLAVSTLAVACLPFSAVAQSRVDAEAFLSPTTYNFVNGVTDLRVAESYRVESEVKPTHILIEGLVPVSPGSDVVTSNYSGINLSSGAVHDVGRLYFTLPEGATTPGVASSPIVGIVARSGFWADFGPEAPDTHLGGKGGALQVDLQAQTLGITLGEFSGTASYTRINDNTLEVDDFSLSNNGITLEFYGTEFVLFGGQLYGIVQAKNPSGASDLMYELNFRALEDFDGDRVPDLLDTSTGQFRPVVQDFKYDRTTGWLWGHDEVWARADYTVGWIYTNDYPWVWSPKEGWIYIYRDYSDASYIFMWSDQRATWIFTYDGSMGWFWKYDGSACAHFFLDQDRCSEEDW